MTDTNNTGRGTAKELLFLLFLFVLLVGWAVALPYNHAPDEEIRFAIPRYIYEHGTLPHGGDEQIRNPIWGSSYGFYPVLSYMISALFMKIASVFSADAQVLLTAARMTSVLFTVGTAFFVIRIGKKVFPECGKWLLVILTALLPGALFIGSYVNNDAMAIFSAAWMVYIWIKGIETEWNYKTCAQLGAAMSICLLSYYNAYGFLVCSFLLFVTTVLLCQKKQWDWKQLFQKGIFIAALVVLLAGWWFVRNYIIYDGDFLGMRTSNQYAEQYAQSVYKPSRHETPFTSGQSFFTVFRSWAPTVFYGFVGVFGYMEIFLPKWIYIFYLLLFVTGMIGCLMNIKKLFALRENGKWRAKGFFHWVMFVAIVIPNLLNLYYSFLVDYQPQGRYSMPMLVPFMYFAAVGLQTIADKFIKNEKIQKVVFLITALLILGIAGYSFLQIR